LLTCSLVAQDECALAHQFGAKALLLAVEGRPHHVPLPDMLQVFRELLEVTATVPDSVSVSSSRKALAEIFNWENGGVLHEGNPLDSILDLLTALLSSDNLQLVQVSLHSHSGAMDCCERAHSQDALLLLHRRCCSSSSKRTEVAMSPIHGSKRPKTRQPPLSMRPWRSSWCILTTT
jgi:hypothetical protein